MKEKLIKLISVLLILHISIALIVIVYPKILPSSKPFSFYKVHIVPGPFFSQSRITTSSYFLLSWKQDSVWSEPINPILDNFKKYNSTLNPSHLYRKRFEWTVNHRFQRKAGKAESPVDTKEFKTLNRYLRDHYVPDGADSIRIQLVQKEAARGHIKWDTLYNITVK